TTGMNEKVAGDHPAEWGSVIHALLDVAMCDENAPLIESAGNMLMENDFDAELAPAAVEVVKSVMRSEIWKRARQAEVTLTEAPFQILLGSEDGAEKPTILRGIIDLIFKENDYWVLVDYKTDDVEKRNVEDIARMYAPQMDWYAKAWERCTGEQVRKKLLLFTRNNQVAELG
ncbi:MAG: hypothetical protein GF307_00650, partial [candidate division Zixibacteria bacterium]|nr:hypothetical protein [candidate division Zixibacteria bacterium]